MPSRGLIPMPVKVPGVDKHKRREGPFHGINLSKASILAEGRNLWQLLRPATNPIADLKVRATYARLVHAVGRRRPVHHTLNHPDQTLLVDGERSCAGRAHLHLEVHNDAAVVRTDDPTETAKRHL